MLGSLGKAGYRPLLPPDGCLDRRDLSLEILRKVRSLADGDGATICNVDSTLIAEAPKILPHAAEMKQNIAKALGISTGQVGIKATTNETMGFAGRGEGMAAHAVAAVTYH